jgi:hypothetical protein
MTASDVIFTGAILPAHLSIKKYYTEFSENPTNNLAADIEPEKVEGQTEKWT